MRMDKPDLTGETDQDLIEAVEKFHLWYDHASLKDQAAWHRWRAIEAALLARRMLARGDLDPETRDHYAKYLQSIQVRCLRIRIWRTTGICPGEG